MLSRDGLIVAAALVAAILLAWVWLLRTDAAMAGMAAHAMPVEPWSAGYLLPAFTMWALMMVAMMLPSAAPMILLHARLSGGGAARTIVFASSYLLVWTGFSALAALLQAALLDLDLVSAMALRAGEPALAAALLAAAAAYQLSGAKAACLDQCRSPIQFILRYRSPGLDGAIRLGLAHGLYCLGCCWALMLLLFVGGVMNLAFVAALALLVLAEKTFPQRWHLSRWTALALFAGAVLLLALG